MKKLFFTLGLATLIPAGIGFSQSYTRPTYSSPIAISRTDLLIWAVNPDDDSVSVIRSDNNTRLAKIAVGDEPQSIALTPDGQYAYVANAAAGTVSIIQISDPAWGTFSASVVTTLLTGAEPWNIVTSPDGLRVFVANSGQDTITVIDATTHTIIGHVNLRDSIANDPDRNRHFQPRGLAVTLDNTKLYVTRFLSFTKPGGRQGDDLGKEGLVAVLNINTTSPYIADYNVARVVTLAPQITGFKFPGLTNPPAPDTLAFPNQLQSIVVRGDRAYLPNIAASPSGPLRFNLDTHAYLNQIGGVNGTSPTDLGATNLHLGAREPEPPQGRYFFANPWAVAFTTQSGAGSAYVVSAASDLLVKLNVDAAGNISFTGDSDTTRHVDLNEPTNPLTSGTNAGKNPQGIAINSGGTRAYVANYVSRNVSVVDLTTDAVIATVQSSDLPAPGLAGETNLVGGEMFFSSRGNFDTIPGACSLRDRLASDAWQSCASCHFKGLTDGVIWQFASGPRKSIALNSTYNPQNRNQQRVLNGSAIFDEIEDFEIYVRNISGPPGPYGGSGSCGHCTGDFPCPSDYDLHHGLRIGADGDLNAAPASLNALSLPNANRAQLTVTLPGSPNKVPALTALREWVRNSVRTPNAPLGGLPNAPALADITAGRTLFAQAGCANCHGGPNWTVSLKDFISPPASNEKFTELNPTNLIGNPVGIQYLNRFLRDIGSFNVGVPGQGNNLGNNIGADEKASTRVDNGTLLAAEDALGRDYNGDGKGIGYNVPSLLGIYSVSPYLHNGAAESLEQVVGDIKHRTANGAWPDALSNPSDQAKVLAFLKSLDATTLPMGSNPTLSLLVTGLGTVTAYPDALTYASGTTVTLTNTPNAGWVFFGWSGDASGTSNPLNVVMTTNKTITANFGQLPTISIPPGDVTAHQGSNATFSVTASSALPLGYQWQFNGSPIPGANASNYTRVAAQGSDAGNYSVVVTNAAGSVTSAVAVLTVIVPPPGVIAQWNFNSFPPDFNATSGTTGPAYGSGTASLVGGGTATFVTGDTAADPAGSTDNSAWDTTSYPSATAANKTAGVRFDVSTDGYKNISVSWQQRVSSQASKYARLQYTTNGTTFIDFPTAIAMSSVGSFESKSNNLATISAVNDKANFGLRLVTEFESTATGSGQSRYVTVSGSGYNGNSPITFDMVTVYGQPLSAPATLHPLGFAAGNFFQLGVTGAPGSSYVLQLSTNLATTNWLPVQTNSSPFIFIESNTIAPQRFYRALFQP